MCQCAKIVLFDNEKDFISMWIGRLRSDFDTRKSMLCCKGATTVIGKSATFALLVYKFSPRATQPSLLIFTSSHLHLYTPKMEISIVMGAASCSKIASAIAPWFSFSSRTSRCHCQCGDPKYSSDSTVSCDGLV